jgi:hypothetical protein
VVEKLSVFAAWLLVLAQQIAIDPFALKNLLISYFA